jgi:hypothetical protein
LSTDPVSQIRRILNGCTPAQRDDIVKLLRTEFRIHRIEREWNSSAEIILEALTRSSDLTRRMFKGILAEAAFKVEIIDKLEGWQDVTPPGNHAFDFVVQKGAVKATIQAKLQRKEKQQPLRYRRPGKRGSSSEFYVVETQKTRAGNDAATGEATRPYRFGEFDILAVSMEPTTGDWSQFRYTVGNWLIPRPKSPTLIAVLQPVSLEANDDWTDSLVTAISWFTSGHRKTISVEKAAEGSGA